MGQDVIKASADMRHLKRNADLFGIPPEDPLIGHNDEPCGIGLIVVNLVCQYLQPEFLTGKSTGNGCLGPILFLCHLSGSKGIVLHTDLFPVVLT